MPLWWGAEYRDSALPAVSGGNSKQFREIVRLRAATPCELLRLLRAILARVAASVRG